MLANWITLSRFPLLAVHVLALYLGPPPVRLAGAVLLLVGLLLDTVDGVVARRTGSTTLAGSVLDIAADRTYELVLWVCFAHLGLVPVAIPLLVITRTTLTDALRSIGIARGEAPFEQERSALARFLVGSAWMRIGYSGGKVATFCGLAVAQAVGGPTWLTALATAAAWLTLGLCLLRGLPVIVGAMSRYWAASAVPAAGTPPLQPS